eukprot:GHVS01016360.1.p1 GENE.GHVS01016360.1~~GHVS01016360.1.p1  ORF type:complete len:260 (+),score=15.39 GHVS01016360.1:52-831(+)
MYSRVLILLAFLCVVSSDVWVWCPPFDHEAPTAPQTKDADSTGSPRCYPLQSPEAFMGNNVNYLLPGYPPLRDFLFEASPRPTNARVQQLMQACVRLWSDNVRGVSGNFRYYEVAHTVQDHFRCDIASFWQEYSERSEVAALKRSTAPAKDVIPCQLSELAESCMMFDSVVSCVRERVSRDVRIQSSDHYASKNDLTKQFYLPNSANTAKLFLDADKWVSDVCKQMSEKMQCGRRVLEVPLLVKDISRRRESGQHAGCF